MGAGVGSGRIVGPGEGTSGESEGGSRTDDVGAGLPRATAVANGSTVAVVEELGGPAQPMTTATAAPNVKPTIRPRKPDLPNRLCGITLAGQAPE